MKKQKKAMSARDAVHEWNVFSYNFPSGFCQHCWRDEPHMADHFERKFERSYKSVGSYGVILALCCELSGHYYERFIEYVVSGEWRECDKWMKETGRY